jgi:DNA-binding response OmpR family regulator
MKIKRNGPRRVLLCGLEPSLETELRNALETDGLDVEVKSTADQPDDHADYIFCSFSNNLGQLLRSLQRQIPVVVVSRTPEAREWIEAMEAGASDYCAAPFERNQIRWILDVNRPAAAMAVA